MHIDKHYEENIIVGDFKSIKLGITIHSDKELKSVEEIKIHSGKLNELAKQIITNELAKVKEERSKTKEE